MSGPPSSRGAALAAVYLTVFLDLLGFGIILPYLPYYAAELGATGIGLGFLFTAYSLAQLFGAAVLGRLSDRFGRRPILLISLAGSTTGMVASGLAETLLTLCLARAVAGLFGGSIATAQAYVADVTAPEERAKYMGLVGASIGLGFVVGPALGAGFVALGFGFRVVAFTAAGLMAANLVLAALRLEEPRRHGASRQPSLADFRAALGRRELAGVLAAMFLVTAAFVAMETTFAFLGRDRFGLGSLSFGLVLTYLGVVMIVVQGGLIGRLTGRFGVAPVAVTGCFMMGLSLLALPACPGLGTALVALGGLAASQGLTAPTLPTLLSQHAGDDRQGAVLGVGQSLGAGARAFGPLVAGSLYDLGVAWPYVLAGLLAAAAGFLVAGVTRASR